LALQPWHGGQAGYKELSFALVVGAASLPGLSVYQV
jgi:hypothetical protein